MLRPTSGYILATPFEQPASLRVYQKESDPPKRAVIVAVGTPYILESGATIECPAKVGDTILHTTIGYEVLKENGKEYRIIHFSKIIGVYEKDSRIEA